MENGNVWNVKTVEDKSDKTWFTGNKLQNQDFLIQKCKICDTNSNVKITAYNNLERNDYTDYEIPHREDLCAKCLKGAFCKNKTY